MNRYQVQDLTIKHRQAQRAAEAKLLNGRAEQIERNKAHEWLTANFPDLTDSNGHLCSWLTVAALELKRAGEKVTPEAVRERRNQLATGHANRFNREDTA